MKATPLNKYGGRRYWRVPVKIEVQLGAHPDATDLFATGKAIVNVIAASPDDAANLVRDEVEQIVDCPTEITAYGPRGGTVHRYTGWWSLTAAKMWSESSPQTRSLFR